MFEGAAVYALIIKVLPYVITLKVVGGVIDIGTHAIKKKIDRGEVK